MATNLAQCPPEPSRGSVNNQVTHHAAQHLARNRHYQPRKHRAKGRTQANQTPQRCRQKLRDNPFERPQVSGSNPYVFRPNHRVNETDSELKPVWVTQQAGEAPGGLRNLDRFGCLQPLLNQLDRFNGQLVAVIEVRNGVGGLRH